MKLIKKIMDENISEQERNSIEKGIAAADAGNLKDHSEARKLYEK